MAEFKFVVDENASKASPELLCFGILGMSLDELVDKIVCNRNGEFDNLYE